MANDDPLRPAADMDDAVPAGASSEADAARAGADGGSEVERLRAEIAALKDRALRDQAEVENFKKRTAREKSESLRYATEGLLRAILPVIDNLQRAVDHARTSREVDALVEGVELVLRSFLDVLERHGVKPVDAHGNQFDPSRHEAIGHVESSEPANTVVAEHQRGYTLHDRLLRPAMVTVGKGPAPTDGDASAEPTRH